MTHWITNRERLRMESPPDDPYGRKAYDFARSWLRGQEYFQLHTSGSTGQPKPIRLSRQQMETSARMTGAALHLPAGTRALVCLHVDFIAGVMMMVRGLLLDWELTIIEPAANPLLTLPENSTFDFVALVPMQLQACLQNPETSNRVERCGTILLGGAPVSLPLEEQILSLKVPVYQSYGMTETVSHIALRRLNGPARRAEYQVLDGIQIGVDNRQCLHVQGAVTDHVLVQTNDVVELTAPDRFVWLGRNDSIINSGGLKIQLNKVDRKVEESFQQLALNPVFFSWYEADEQLGQKLVLFVEGTEGNWRPDELMKQLRQKVKPYEVPKAVYFVPEFFRTPTDKLDKIATAEFFFNRQA